MAKQHHYHRTELSQNRYSCTKPKTIEVKKACFFLYQSSPNIILPEDLVIRSSEPVEMPGIRVQYSSQLLSDTNFKLKFWICLENSGHITTLVYCVDYRNRPRYCCQRSIGWGRGDQRGYPPKKLFAYFVVLCFVTRCPKTNTVAPLISTCFALKKNFGLATLLQRSAFLWLLQKHGQVICGAEHWRSQDFYSGGDSHLTYVRLFLPYIFE